MLSSNIILADYRETGIPRYNDNPFIEALPPILEPKSVIEALRSRVDIVYSDKRASPTKRSHLLVGLMNNFFQPIIRHVQLESKLSIMLREGYYQIRRLTRVYISRISQGVSLSDWIILREAGLSEQRLTEEASRFHRSISRLMETENWDLNYGNKRLT